MDVSNESISIYIGTDSTSRADSVEEWLRKAGATDVTDDRDAVRTLVLPLIPIVIGAVIAGGALADFARKWRLEHQSEQIITYHDGKIDVQIIDGIKNGKIIIIADGGAVIEVDKVPDNIDLTAVAKAAATASASVAKEMIVKAGGTATVTRRLATR